MHRSRSVESAVTIVGIGTQANDWECSQNKRLQEARRNDEKRIRKLEKELRHKEKSLAETAALLVLSKKLKAIWGGTRKDDQWPGSQRDTRTGR